MRFLHCPGSGKPPRSPDEHCLSADLDECAFPGVCPSGVCTNTAGSFSCKDCDGGYRPSPLGDSCEGMSLHVGEDTNGMPLCQGHGEAQQVRGCWGWRSCHHPAPQGSLMSFSQLCCLTRGWCPCGSSSAGR